MGNIHVEQKDRLRVDEQAVEFVERKGLGHPDSLIDGIVENVSLELIKEYIDSCGYILHHNVDKGLIIGGSSEVGFRQGSNNKADRGNSRGEGSKEVPGLGHTC